MRGLRILSKTIILFFAALLLASCAETKYVPDGSYLLDKVKVTVDQRPEDVSTAQAKSYARQQENVRWFSLVKLPLGVYSLSGRDSTKWMNRLLKSMGEPPVLYDSALARLTVTDLQQMLFNKGYLDSRVELWTRTKGKKLSTIYKLYPGQPYQIGRLEYRIADPVINDELGLEDSLNWGLKPGSQFRVEELDHERKRITKLLNDRGYYRFHKDFVRYEADTTGHQVNLKLVLSADKTGEGLDTLHQRYKIRNLTYESGSRQDSTIHLRKKVLRESTYIKENGYYSGSDLQNTYNHFGRLGAVKYTNIQFREVPDTTLLDCRIQLQTNKPSTVSFQPEGTNTAGDFGAAATLTYQNRNLFRGAENLSVELRGAFEAIEGLEGYSNSNFLEYSLETRLTFPRFILPFLSADTRRRAVLPLLSPYLRCVPSRSHV